MTEHRKDSKVRPTRTASVDVNLISATERVRSINEAQVAALVESIHEVGLLHPITVYETEIYRNGNKVPGYGLIAGAHRLLAFKRLGRSEITAIVVEMDRHQRAIAECDENLAGTRLTPAERAEFTHRRKVAYEALHPETVREATLKRGVERPSRQDGETAPFASRFTADTATKTGKSERVVQRDAERGAKVSDAAMALLKGTKLDTGKYLDGLKAIPADKQVTAVKRDLAPKPEGPARAAVRRAVERAQNRGNEPAPPRSTAITAADHAVMASLRRQVADIRTRIAKAAELTEISGLHPDMIATIRSGLEAVAVALDAAIPAEPTSFRVIETPVKHVHVGKINRIMEEGE